jgi:hypothetical protein
MAIDRVGVILDALRAKLLADATEAGRLAKVRAGEGKPGDAARQLGKAEGLTMALNGVRIAQERIKADG